MATAYKTPGVYIEEIPKFPPSIASVETAIPAFVGYTETAQKIKPDDLINVPTRIGSIAEYEAWFGAGYTPNITSVNLDDNKKFKDATITNTFYMYDSLRLFYANGGGDCYIISTGSYETAGKVVGDFTNPAAGLTTLVKIDEPTILVFPDNSLLSTGNEFYGVYMAALAQCSSLQDRVALLHVKEDDPKGEDFRSGIGINDLKYGAVYSPWLEVNLPKTINFRGFKDVIHIGASSFKLEDLTTDAASQASIAAYNQIIADVNGISTISNALASTSRTLRDKFTGLQSAYAAAKTVANFIAVINFLFEIARKVDQLIGTGGSSITFAELKTSVQGLVGSTLKGIYSTLIAYDKEFAEEVTDYTVQFSAGTPPSATQWGNIFGASAPSTSSVITAATDAERMGQGLALLRPVFDRINDAWLSGVIVAANGAEQKKHEGLLATFPLYKSIITGIQSTSTAVPPSGAVAGIYAYVDRTRGVWKAPANVSLSGVIGPKDSFTASELERLNVDPNSGKSVNAIRSFLGKGTLVFGARTLAGNDNEWRYVSVRRFFNFVEESVKKATEQFVFEPNDANTWVKVQGMIENFLTTLWRQGALQGVKPEHAFYVAVGLGKTMTALDILEGRMIVEIGMAAVRPAEFIILRFSHKMAES